MNTGDSHESATDKTLLEQLAEQLGDPLLFPPDVCALHARGKVRRARARLLRHARRYERTADRAARQQELAADLRLWVDPGSRNPLLGTLNGFGAGFVGQHQPAADGSYVATQWLLLLFLPVWPIAAYLVLRTGANTWQVFGRVPFPPTAGRLRGIVGVAVAVAAALALGAVSWQSVHTNLLAYNGFDRSVIVEVGTERQVVPSREYVVFGGLPLRPTPVRARLTEGAEPFDELDVDLRGHAGDRIIYNVARRAVLGVGFVLYGPGTPRELQLLDPDPVLFLEQESVHYLFTAPPDSLRIRTGASPERAILFATDAVEQPTDAVFHLESLGREAHALAVAQAELVVHPENAALVSYTAHVLLRGDTGAQRALVRASLERAPENVDVHRAYQDVVGWDTAGVRAEYLALLARHPDSPMYRYLVGRAMGDTSREAVAHFAAALDVDPEYLPAHRALGYVALRRGVLSEAVRHYDRMASLGADAALEAFELRLRVRRQLAWDPQVAERIILETQKLNPDDWSTRLMHAHLRMERGPAAFDAESDSLIARLADGLPPEAAAAVVPNLRAMLAITAGRLHVARTALQAVTPVEERHVATAVRLALSRGAEPADRDLVTEIPEWYLALTPIERLGARELLPPEEQPTARALPAYPDYMALLTVLDDPAALTRPGALDSALDRNYSGLRAMAYFVAARRTAAQTDPGTQRVHAQFLARARAFSLPGELPYLGR